MKYLVTGATGFIGSHLVDLLIKRGHKVCGLSKEVKLGYLKDDNLSRIRSSILEPDELDKNIIEYEPDIVFHLAAQSSPGSSLASPAYTFSVNTIGTINLLESLKKLDKIPRVILASSSAVYGTSLSDKAINEEYSIGPSSAYGLSKYNMEQIAEMYIKQNNMDIVIARPFFLIGPRKVDDVCSAFARSIVAIELGLRSYIKIGNLEIVRDFLDVRDGIEALYLIANKGITGESYNICSGVGYSLRSVLDLFKKQSKHILNEKIDASIIRSIDELIRIGDPGKIKMLGWQPRREIKTTLAEVLQFWRGQEL